MHISTRCERMLPGRRPVRRIPTWNAPMPSAVTHPESLLSAVGSNASLTTLHASCPIIIVVPRTLC